MGVSVFKTDYKSMLDVAPKAGVGYCSRPWAEVIASVGSEPQQEAIYNVTEDDLKDYLPELRQDKREALKAGDTEKAEDIQAKIRAARELRSFVRKEGGFASLAVCW